jgi:low affinity Fe/Cu permease
LEHVASSKNNKKVGLDEKEEDEIEKKRDKE